MEQTTTLPKIYSALHSIMAELEPITKARKNQQQGYSYRGVDDVYNVLNEMLVKHQVIIKPNCIDKEITEFESARGGKLFRVFLTMEYTCISIVDGSTLSLHIIGEAMDSGDKATNKAMSNAYKYMCFQLFCIPTDEPKDSEIDTHEVKPTQSATPEPAKWLDIKDKSGKITPEWQNLISGIELGTVKSVAEVRKYYKISKAVAEEIEKLLKPVAA